MVVDANYERNFRKFSYSQTGTHVHNKENTTTSEKQNTALHAFIIVDSLRTLQIPCELKCGPHSALNVLLESDWKTKT